LEKCIMPDSGPEPKTEDAKPVVAETLAEKLGTAPDPAPAPAPDSGLKLVLQFVVFPLLIVFLAVVIVGFFQWLGQDRRTYSEYLSEISTGWKRKRPEAAYQLLYRLSIEKDEILKEANVGQTVGVFLAAKKERDEDASPKSAGCEVRQYLAIILGHLGSPEALPALQDAVSAAEPDRETRLNATWALGKCGKGDAGTAQALAGLLEDPFPGQRTAAAFALGDLAPTDADRAHLGAEALARLDAVAALGRDPLAKHLADEKLDVRWNTALALSRLHDERALPTLLSMLDRKNLDSIQGERDDEHLPMEDKDRDQVMVNALRGVLALKAVSALDRVSALGDGDRSLEVRQRAMEVRDQLKALAAAPKSGS
jgi:HEAT repeat protein